jgi:hypothetical protein
MDGLHRRRLARADFVLACVRSVIRSTYESYTKYSMAGAWAGAILGSSNGSCEIYFDSKQDVTPPSDRSRVFRADDIRVSIYGADQQLLDVAAAKIPDALRRAALAVPDDADDIFIQSLHICFLLAPCQGGESPEAHYDRVCAHLASQVGLPYSRSPLMDTAMPDQPHQGDLAFELVKPTEASSLTSLARLIFPDIKDIEGWGALPLHCVDPSVTWAHVYCRYFFREPSGDPSQ